MTDEAGARDLAKVNAPAFGMRPKMFEDIDYLDLWHGDGYGYVGYVAGRAAGVPGNALRVWRRNDDSRASARLDIIR